MRWIKKDLEQYIQAKEYVDTMIIPLMPLQLINDTNIVNNGFQNEVLAIFIKEIEKDLAGRVMVTPNYTYVKSALNEQEVNRINSWITEISNQPFKNTFLITFDSSWKKIERSLDATLMWLPGLQSGDLYSKEMRDLIQDQVKQISELIKSYWETIE